MNAQTPRERQSERDHAEWLGWAEAQGIDPEGTDYAEYGADGLHEAFLAGMRAQRDLDAVTGNGTLRARITSLAETWEGNPELTAEGALMRDLAEILRDELAFASDKPGVTG